MDKNQDISFGRMSQEHSHQIKEKTIEEYLKKLQRRKRIYLIADFAGQSARVSRKLVWRLGNN